MASSSVPVNPLAAELQGLRANWFWFLILGVVLIVLGMMAIGSPFVFTTAAAMVVGILLMAGGATDVASAFWARSWGGVILHVLAGVLYLVLGFLMATHPIGTAAVLTLMIAACFLIGGLARIILSVLQRFPNWGWVFLNGIITFALGVMIWRDFPESALWVIGLFIGIELVFNGWTWVMMALAVRSVPSAPSTAQ